MAAITVLDHSMDKDQDLAMAQDPVSVADTVLDPATVDMEDLDLAMAVAMVVVTAVVTVDILLLNSSSMGDRREVALAPAVWPWELVEVY